MDWKFYNSPKENKGVHDYVDRINFLLPEYVNTNPRARSAEEMVLQHIGDTAIMLSRETKHQMVNISFIAPEFKFLLHLPESVMSYKEVQEIITHSINTKLNKHYFVTKIGFILIKKGFQELQYQMIMDYGKADKAYNLENRGNGQ